MDDTVSSTTNQSQQTDSAPIAVFSNCSTRASSTDRATSDVPFKVNEIICLENDCRYLYGEVIQLLPSRGLCWFRPMCLVVSQGSGDRPSPIIEPTQLIDLQSGSDLLWPITLFRPALDTEVVSLLPLLGDRYSPSVNTSNKQDLNRFIQQVWQDNRDKF